MMDALKNYIERYTQLELGLLGWIRKKASPLCDQCTCFCCDKIICVEAIESPFLRRVHQRAAQFDESMGFISPTGCVLEKGRPSVCYEYFCDDHFYYQPDELHAEVLKILGGLLNHATRNALGDVPVYDILMEEELDRMDFELLEKQMNESLCALEIISTFYREGTLSDASYQLLQQIRLLE